MHPKVIDAVNKALDKPDHLSKALSLLTGSVTKKEQALTLGIDRIGHRAANHDLISAVLVGYSKAGYDGALASICHLLEDRLSDDLRKVSAKGIFELIVNSAR